MKRTILLSLLGCGLTAAAAVPRVSDVAMTSFGKCGITYTLSEAPGIVTFDILTNGVSIGQQNLTNAVGDVNRLVRPAAVRSDGTRGRSGRGTSSARRA